MTACKTGDVVLVRFPFTDLASEKRPRYSSSVREFSIGHGDIVVVPLTGRTEQHGLRLDKWREAGLVKPTWLKTLIATVAESLVENRLGKLRPEDDGKVKLLLSALVDTRFLGG